MHHIQILTAISNHLENFIMHGGYFLLFILTLLEGIPILGMIFPGHAAVIIGGFLAKIHTLDLTLVLVVSILGALIGDYANFYLGRRYGLPLIERFFPRFFITESQIEKAKALLNKHTGKALIAGRFTPATRSLMPFLVGASQTSTERFWLFNIIGGVAWVVSSVMIGYIFGFAYSAVSGYMGKIVLISILAAFFIVWTYKFVNSRFHIFKRYELFTLILNVLSLWFLAAIIDQLIDKSFKLNFDILVNVFMDKINHLYPSIVTLANLISTIGGTEVMILLGLIIGSYYFFKKKWRSSFIMFCAIGSTTVVTWLLKELFLSPRPINAINSLTDPSFPSGHSSLAAAFFVILAYLLATRINSLMKRESMIVACVLAVIVIGLSRLVLNVHWFSDVAAGWALGVFLATSSILFVRYVGVLILKNNTLSEDHVK